MAQLNPYLTFDGNCREAMEFYKSCFGGELTMQTIGESPMKGQMPGLDDNIMHAMLSSAGLVLMASDMMGEEDISRGNSISLSINCSSEKELKDLFTRLSKGGKVTHPIKTEFWGALFGMLEDKYGINWMLNYQKK